jgi:polyisoprenoid-binding protein YceI
MSSTALWKLDPGHSHIQFKVKHLSITNVNGIFKTFEGTVDCPDEGFDNAAVKIAIAAYSIDTQLPDRDKHLKSAHLFDTVNYPQIQFDGVLKKTGQAYVLEGSLTIRETTHPIRLETEFTGAGKGFAGDERAGFEARGSLSRKDYGLTWNIAAAGGGLVIGDDIKLQFDIELVKL